MPEGTKYPPPVFDAKTLSPPPAPPLRPIPRPTVELVLLKIREQSSALAQRRNVPPEAQPQQLGVERHRAPRRHRLDAHALSLVVGVQAQHAAHCDHVGHGALPPLSQPSPHVERDERQPIRRLPTS